eukprot:TRINITY_DN14226_c0_g1_i1.p1 TRINITY_DN14226_c0_g1~~TRINITY_DN14226_c0_g1_i1.p1  ORF type:complete len:269 (-),score=45.82 TRINITY_DN14226_c0_g1_i1:126-932(-)
MAADDVAAGSLDASASRRSSAAGTDGGSRCMSTVSDEGPTLLGCEVLPSGAATHVPKKEYAMSQSSDGISAGPRYRGGGCVLRLLGDGAANAVSSEGKACHGSPGEGDAAPHRTLWDQLEVLLVSRRRVPGSYTLPAGKYETQLDGNSFEACALRETREEAGIEGEILFDLDWYGGMSKDGTETKTRFFAMRYVRELHWEEEGERRRLWFPLSEARELVKHSHMLSDVMQRLSTELESKTASEVFCSAAQERTASTTADSSCESSPHV